MKRITCARLLSLTAVLSIAMSGCSTNSPGQVRDNSSRPVREKGKGGEAMQKDPGKEVAPFFEGLTLTVPLKSYGDGNPLMTQHFGADPFVMVYKDRVYVYMTGDFLQTDDAGNPQKMTYRPINTIRILSSSDLSNWTDHGEVKAAGGEGAAPWAACSWAPAAAYRESGENTKFFLYFANSGNGIGVLVADSPTGPFRDPLGGPLVSRSTPNCGEKEVPWLFDPAVFVDDDGKAWLYFGGGIPNQQYANPRSARAVQLGEDMISLAGDPVMIDAPYMFEDSGINKIDGLYYYSYCTNFNVPADAGEKLGINNAEIAYMTSKNPLGPFGFQRSILKNPGVIFGVGQEGGNNHHCLFRFRDRWYIAYHARILEAAMGFDLGCRNSNIDEVRVTPDGTIAPITGTRTGVSRIGFFDPYQWNEAKTIGVMAGVSTKCSRKNDGSEHITVTDIDSGDWIALHGVDFGDDGAIGFSCRVSAPEKHFAALQIRLDSPEGEIAGYVKIAAGQKDAYSVLTTALPKKITGVHDLIFIFYGGGFEFDQWRFTR